MGLKLCIYFLYTLKFTVRFFFIIIINPDTGLLKELFKDR